MRTSWSQSEWVGGVQASPSRERGERVPATHAGPGALSMVLALSSARWPQRGVDQRDLGEAGRVTERCLVLRINWRIV